MKPNRGNLTAQRLRELVHYEPATGMVTWRVTRAGHMRGGAALGRPTQRDTGAFRLMAGATRSIA